MHELNHIIDDALPGLCNPSIFMGYLKSVSYFHKYSWRNILLIYSQMPTATKLAEFSRWKQQYGRKIKYGSKTIKILSPIEQEPRKKLIEKTNTKTGEVLLDNNGKRIFEEIIIPMSPQFKETKVLDISQTEGSPLPRIAGDVISDNTLYDAFIKAVKRFYASITQNELTSHEINEIIFQICREKLKEQKLTRDLEDMAINCIARVIFYRFGLNNTMQNEILSLEKCEPEKQHLLLETIQSTSNAIISPIKDLFALICKEFQLNPLTISTPNSPKQMSPLPPAVKIPPDTGITISDRNKYGYTRPELLPLTHSRAVILFERGLTIYLLNKNNTEAMAFYLSDIAKHDGIFGISQSEWQNSREYMAFASGNVDAINEAEFIYSTNDSFAIFQLKRYDKNIEPFIFKTYEYLAENGLEIIRSNYHLAFSAQLPQPPSDTPEGVFMWFNAECPMQTSDILSIKKDGVITSYYVNGRNYQELLAFLGMEGKKKKPRPQSSSNASTSSTTLYHPAPDTDMTSVQMPVDEINDSMPFHYTEVAVYTQTAEKAAEYGHLEEYERSRLINISCCEAIDREIWASRKGNNRYELSAAAQRVAKEYGESRTAWVLGIYVLNNTSDFSQRNLTWAEKALSLLGFDDKGRLLIPYEAPPFTIKTPYVVLNVFIKRFNENNKRKKSFSERVEKAKRASNELQEL